MDNGARTLNNLPKTLLDAVLHPNEPRSNALKAKIQSEATSLAMSWNKPINTPQAQSEQYIWDTQHPMPGNFSTAQWTTTRPDNVNQDIRRIVASATDRVPASDLKFARDASNPAASAGARK